MSAQRWEWQPHGRYAHGIPCAWERYETRAEAERRAAELRPLWGTVRVRKVPAEGVTV